MAKGLSNVILEFRALAIFSHSALGLLARQLPSASMTAPFYCNYEAPRIAEFFNTAAIGCYSAPCRIEAGEARNYRLLNWDQHVKAATTQHCLHCLPAPALLTEPQANRKRPLAITLLCRH
jgi:hypothetical protein